MHANKSFTLIEVLIFVSILSLVFVTAATTTVYFLHSLKANEYKLIATRYSEELIEWLKAQKDIDWTLFTQKSDKTYCFNTTPIVAWPSEGSCTLYNLDSLYYRQVTLQSIIDGNGVLSQVSIAQKVQWLDSGNTYNIPINTRFSLWE